MKHVPCCILNVFMYLFPPWRNQDCRSQWANMHMQTNQQEWGTQMPGSRCYTWRLLANLRMRKKHHNQNTQTCTHPCIYLLNLLRRNNFPWYQLHNVYMSNMYQTLFVANHHDSTILKMMLYISYYLKHYISLDTCVGVDACFLNCVNYIYRPFSFDSF